MDPRSGSWGGERARPPERLERRRSSRAVLWAGLGLLLLAVVAPTAMVVAVINPAYTVSGVTIAANGREHRLELPARQRYVVYVREDRAVVPACVVRDDDGMRITSRVPSSRPTVDGWRAAREFRTGAGPVTVVCQSRFEATDVMIGPRVNVSAIVTGVAGAIGAGIVFGLGGIVTLLIAFAQRFTR